MFAYIHYVVSRVASAVINVTAHVAKHAASVALMLVLIPTAAASHTAFAVVLAGITSVRVACRRVVTEVREMADTVWNHIGRMH